MNNPAFSLINLISDIEEYGTSNCSLQSIYQNIFTQEGEPELSYFELYSKHAKVFELIEQSQHLVENIDSINPDVYLGWIPKMKSAFSGGINVSLQHSLQRFDDTSRNYLEITSDLIEREYDVESKISALDCDGLLKSINGLLQDVRNSDLGYEVKTYFLAKLRELQIAIDDYMLSGKSPIIDVVDSVVGHLARDRNFQQVSKSNETGRGFWKLIQNVVIMLGLLNGGAALSQNVYDALPYLSEDNKEEKAKDKES